MRISGYNLYDKSYKEYLFEKKMQDSVEAWREYLNASNILFRMRDEGFKNFTAGTTYKYRFTSFGWMEK